jgi:hypothetical protein
MPKKPRENRAFSTINSRVNHAITTSGPPFSLERIPGEAWKCLCLVAWKRLERINPRWAHIIEAELANFDLTWKSNGYWCRKEYLGDKTILSRHGGNVSNAWLVEAFQSMLDTSVKKGPRPLSESYNLRVVLQHYDQLVLAVKALKKEGAKVVNKPIEEREKFYREGLQTILNQQPYHNESGSHAKVTTAMLGEVLAEKGTASDVASEILYHLDGISPSTLKKKVVPRLRKAPLSPIEFWRKKLLESPR